MIMHKFTIERDGNSYTDSLILPEDDYKKLSEAEIEGMKEERYSNWKNMIDNPPQPVELKDLPKEDLEAQAQSIDEQIVSLQAQKAQVAEAIVIAKPKPIEIKPIEEPIEPII